MRAVGTATGRATGREEPTRLPVAGGGLPAPADPNIQKQWSRPMDEELRRGLQAEVAKAMAMFWVRNTQLDNLHAGIVPVTRTGDYCDVTVIDADGRRIPWPEVSHFDDDAMRDLMRQVVDRLYTFQELAGDPRMSKLAERVLFTTSRLIFSVPRFNASLTAGSGARGLETGSVRAVQAETPVLHAEKKELTFATGAPLPGRAVRSDPSTIL